MALVSRASRAMPKTSSRSLVIFLRVGFILIGIITVLLGQILPTLSLRLSLNDQESGYLFIGQFVGSLFGTLCYSRLVRKFGYLKMLFGGFCLMGFGCAGVNSDSWFWCTTAVSSYGYGIGLTIPAINMLVVELDRDNSASALNTINFFWGVGAILCKPFIDRVGTPTSVVLPTIILSVLLLSVGFLIVFSNYEPDSKQVDTGIGASIPIWTTATAWLVATFNFIHVGIESSVGGWITTYQARLVQSTTSGWISAALVFFLMLVVGRGIAPAFFRFFKENTVLFASLILMTCGILLILLTESFALLLTGSAVLGFGCSSVFPTNMSRFTRLFGSQATRSATPIFVFGGLGGAFITWLVGFTSTTFDSLRTGFLVILTSSVLLIIVQIVLVSAKPK
jgi:FHS family glucose/mannose:H+ symporter-like MFS transporter